MRVPELRVEVRLGKKHRIKSGKRADVEVRVSRQREFESASRALFVGVEDSVCLSLCHDAHVVAETGVENERACMRVFDVDVEVLKVVVEFDPMRARRAERLRLRADLFV